MNSDFLDLLATLENYQVKYLIIGGYAVMHYSEPRYTKDLDIWVEASEVNGIKIYEALTEFKAPISTLKPKDFATSGHFYQMGQPPVRIDILMSVKGVDFEEAWEKRVRSKFQGIEVNFISKKDLIASKKAAGRMTDLVDVENLEKS